MIGRLRRGCRERERSSLLYVFMNMKNTLRHPRHDFKALQSQVEEDKKLMRKQKEQLERLKNQCVEEKNDYGNGQGSPTK